METYARVNNKILKVLVVDANYNDHAVEAKILEGSFKGVPIIIENRDLTPLVNIENDINNLSMYEALKLNAWAVNNSMDKTLPEGYKEVYDMISDIAIKRIAKLHKQAKKNNISASMMFGKFVNEDTEERYITVDIEVRGNSEEEVENAFIKLSDKLENEGSINIKFAKCPTIEEEKNGRWIYQDAFIIEYEHGCMTEIKKDLKKDFKSFKKELKLR